MRFLTAIAMLVVRIIRLPLDLLFFTGAFLKVSFWLLRQLPAKLSGIPSRVRSPCSPSDADDDGAALCSAAKKYGNPGLLRLLCPWIAPVSSAGGRRRYACRRDTHYRVSVVRYLGAFLILALLWGAVATGGGWLAFRRFGLRVPMPPFMTPRPPVADDGLEPIRPVETPPDSPGDSGVFLAKAQEHMASRNFNNARIEFKNAIQRDPSSIEAQLGLGECALQLGIANEARLAFERVLQLAPGTVEARLKLAKMDLDERRLEAALNMYRELTTRDPTLYTWRARLAELLIATGKLDDGYNEAVSLLNDRPGDVTGHLVLANLFLRGKLPTLAIEHCNKALVHSPGDIRAHRILAMALMDKGDTQRAVRSIEQILQVLPNDLEMQMRLAMCHETLNDSERALQTLLDAAGRHPGSPLPFVQAAQVHVNRNDTDKAIDFYRRALERDPANLVALNNVAVLLLDRRREPQEALALALRAYREHPQNPRVMDTVGWAYFHNNELDKALELLSAAVPNLGNNPIAHYHLGTVLHAKGDYLAARRELETALQMTDRFNEADKAKELLESVRRHLEGER